MANKNIPISFTLFGQEIKVLLRKTLLKKHRALGMYKTNENKVELQCSTKASPISAENIESTLWHEIVHAILDKNSYDKLNDDEEFVDRMANSIREVVNTFKYKE